LHFAFFIFIILCGFFSIAHADVGDILTKFHPYIGVQEDYSSNINLTPTNPKEDFITTIAPGLRFSTAPITYSLIPGQFQAAPMGPGMVITPGQFPQPAPAPDAWGVDLNYLLGLVSYAKNSQYNFVSHAGTLNAWYSSDPRFSLRLRDYFIRSENPREQEYAAGAPRDQFIPAIQRNRAVYSRNVLEPTMEYQFGKEDRILLYYRNNIYQTENPSAENSQENFINPRLNYWFDIRNGISLEYGLTLGDFQSSPDLVGHMARARYIYRFDPHTSIFGEDIFMRRDFAPPGIDYDVHNPSIGIEHAFSPTLTARLQAGYYLQIPERGSTNNGITYDLGLTQIIEKTTLALSFQGGYTEVFFGSQNLGLIPYYRSIARISHWFTERTNSALSGSYEIIEYSSGQKDDIWRVSGNASYLALKWLALSVTISYLEDNSNVGNGGYRESRAILWAVVNP
jgi:hypothetical protein